MSPRVAAAIITGTMARPSRPSVRFTELPAPAMTMTPRPGLKNRPRSTSAVLKNGRAEPCPKAPASTAHDEAGGDRRHEDLQLETLPIRRSRGGAACVTFR